MRGNGYGSYRVTREADMAAYDMCPPPLRQAQAYAVACWASKPILEDYYRGRKMGLDHQETCRRIIKNMDEDERGDTRKAYGPSHPEARPAPARQKPRRA